MRFDLQLFTYMQDSVFTSVQCMVHCTYASMQTMDLAEFILLLQRLNMVKHGETWLNT